MYRRGTRITSNAQIAGAVATIGAHGVLAAHVHQALKDSGKVIVTKYGVIPLEKVAPAAITAGAAAVGLAIGAKNMYQDRRLREYYGHSRKEKKYDYR